jgi:hypothetical protein
MTCFVGGINTYLIYKILVKKQLVQINWAVFASFIYAVFPICVLTDQKVILEPFLNLFLLLGLLFLSYNKATDNFKLVLSAICFGLACSFKIWGLIFTVAVIGFFLITKRLKEFWQFGLISIVAFLLASLPYFINNLAALPKFWQYLIFDQFSVTTSNADWFKKIVSWLILILWLTVICKLVIKYISDSHTVILISVFTGLSLASILFSRQYWHYWDWMIPFAIMFLICVLYGVLASRKYLVFKPKLSIIMVFVALLPVVLTGVDFYCVYQKPEQNDGAQPFKLSYVKDDNGLINLQNYLKNNLYNNDEFSNVKSQEILLEPAIYRNCVYGYADELVLANVITHNYENKCFLPADIFGQFINDKSNLSSEEMYFRLPNYAKDSNYGVVLVPDKLASIFETNSDFLLKYKKVKVYKNIQVWQNSSL